MFGTIKIDSGKTRLRLVLLAWVGIATIWPIAPSSAQELSNKGQATGNSKQAEKAASKATAIKKPATNAAIKRPLTSAEREAAAIAFAREHHPELATLVEKLRTDNRREFDKAIRELTATRDRLSRLEKQSRPQYELALKAWKLDSRANLLAARMTVSNDSSLEADLKRILRERVDVRLEELQAESTRLEKRLGTVRTMIRNIESDREAVAARDLERVKRTVVKNRRPVSKKPATLQTKPAVKPVVAERSQQSPVPKLRQTPEQVSQPASTAKPQAE